LMAGEIHRAASFHSSIDGPSTASSDEARRAGPSLDDFQTIYREHYPAIWRFLVHLGVRKRDAADVTHNVFLIAHRKLSTFEHRSSVRTWLCGIAFRVGRDFEKSAAVRLEVPVDDPAVIDEIGSGRSIEMREDGQLALARRLLDALPAEQHEVFVLHELEQMTGSEIAALMGTSIGTVRSRLRRARDSFRRQLAELAREGALDV